MIGLALWARAAVADDMCASRASFEFRPGVVVDQAHARAYVMSPAVAIDAVDLGSGRLLWSTRRAAKPLILAGDVLIGQAEVPDRPNTLRLVGLDVAKGGHPTFEADVDLPAGTVASIADGLGTSLRVAAWRHADAIVLPWTFSQVDVGGPPPRDGGDHARRITGTIRLDPRTGSARLLGPAETAAPPPSIPAAIAAKALPGPLWNTGRVVATARRSVPTGKSGMTLLRWDCATGDAFPDLALFGPEYTLRYPSPDHQHLLASTPQPGTPRPWRWRIFALDSGARVADIDMEWAGAPFFVRPGLLIHEAPLERRMVAGKVVEEPLRLRALDLASGQELWTRPIRDTAYRGPYPPRRSPR
jgi:hypothetical protein